MSHRVTFKSEIKDYDLAVSALKASEYDFKASDNKKRIDILSGPLARASINLTTGEVISDTDFHRKDQLGALRQAYSEAEFRRMASERGVVIESREVMSDGCVKLRCISF